MKNNYLKLFLLIFLIILFNTACFGKKSEQILNKIIIQQNRIEDFIFIKNMNGLENIYLDNDSLRLFATGLDGNAYIVDGDSRESLQVIKKKKLFNESCLDIEKGPDNYFYVSGCDSNWQDKSGYIIKTDEELNRLDTVTSYYKGINGLCFIDNYLYFAAGNMSFTKSTGNIYKLDINNDSSQNTPNMLFHDAVSSNGLFFNKKENALYYTVTLKGVYKLNIMNNESEKVFGKSRIVEGFDDLCVDKNNRVWVGDQPNGCIKMFDPSKNIIYKIEIEGIGVITSCMIRVENNEEILYLTEMKEKGSRKYDGRGIIVIPLNEITDLLK